MVSRTGGNLLALLKRAAEEAEALAGLIDSALRPAYGRDRQRGRREDGVSEDKIVNFVQRLKEKRAALEEAAHEDQKQITARDREFDIAIGELFGGLAAIHTHFVKYRPPPRVVPKTLWKARKSWQPYAASLPTGSRAANIPRKRSLSLK